MQVYENLFTTHRIWTAQWRPVKIFHTKMCRHCVYTLSFLSHLLAKEVLRNSMLSSKENPTFICHDLLRSALYYFRTKKAWPDESNSVIEVQPRTAITSIIWVTMAIIKRLMCETQCYPPPMTERHTARHALVQRLFWHGLLNKLDVLGQPSS